MEERSFYLKGGERRREGLYATESPPLSSVCGGNLSAGAGRLGEKRYGGRRGGRRGSATWLYLTAATFRDVSTLHNWIYQSGKGLPYLGGLLTRKALSSIEMRPSVEVPIGSGYCTVGAGLNFCLFCRGSTYTSAAPIIFRRALGREQVAVS